MRTGARVGATVVWAMILGALLAAPFSGEERRLSVEVWLVITSGWLAWSVTRRTLAAAPLAPSRLRGLFQWRRRQATDDRQRPRQLLALEGTVIAARDNERAFAHRLRPRLREAVDHCLRFEHGIDTTEDPAKAAAALGSTAWLVDPSVDDRRPTIDELDQLFDILTAQPPPGAP